MALDTDSVSFTTWTDAEVAEGVRFGQSKFERMAQNQIAFNNRLNNQDNAWSLGDDFHAHFSFPNVETNDTFSTGFFDAGNAYQAYSKAVQIGGGTTNHTQGAHVWQFATTGSGQIEGVGVAGGYQPDEVPIIVEARAYNDTYATGVHISFIGIGNDNLRTSSTQTTLVDGDNSGDLTCAGFVTGTTTNTWDAVTYESGTERTRTASLAGTNYTSWDRLKVEVDSTSARFYVHDGTSWVLRATHTTQIAAIAATVMYGFVQGVYKGGSGGSLFADYLSVKALSNVEAT